jgi:branched-chain amino acid transport system ATP-binding protein
MTGSDVVLEARQLSKEFLGFRAVDDFSLRIREGSIHALIGPNGAGKTTVFNMLTKVYAPTSGRIVYRGEDVTALSPSAIARKGIGRSFQISAIFPRLTVLENVRVALQRKLDFTYRFWRGERLLERLNTRANELLEAVGAADEATTIAGELPYGRRRALELATTLALDPDVLLLDEPTSGLGGEDIARITALIRQASANRTIVMVEHNLSVVADLSDTITVLVRGHVLAEGNYATVSSDRAVIEAYLGGGHG